MAVLIELALIIMSCTYWLQNAACQTVFMDNIWTNHSLFVKCQTESMKKSKLKKKKTTHTVPEKCPHVENNRPTMMWLANLQNLKLYKQLAHTKHRHFNILSGLFLVFHYTLWLVPRVSFYSLACSLWFSFQLADCHILLLIKLLTLSQNWKSLLLFEYWQADWYYCWPTTV